VNLPTRVTYRIDTDTKTAKARVMFASTTPFRCNSAFVAGCVFW